MNWEKVLKIRRPYTGISDKLFKLAFQIVVENNGGRVVSRTEFYHLMRNAIEILSEKHKKDNVDYRSKVSKPTSASKLNNTINLFTYLKRVIGVPRANFIKDYTKRDNTGKVHFKIPESWKQGD